MHRPAIREDGTEPGVVAKALRVASNRLGRAYAANRVRLVALSLVALGALHAAGKLKELDTLATALVTAGLLLLLVGDDIIRWSASNLQSFKGLGIEVTLVPTPTDAAASGDLDSSRAVNVGDLENEVERRLRSASHWTALGSKGTALSRDELLAELTQQGYLDRADAIVLEVLFNKLDHRRTPEVLFEAQALSERLRIGILLRAAELSFELRGLVPERPRAPRSIVGYHFTVTARDGVRVYVAVIIAKKDSELAPARADKLGTVPGASHRWLVPYQVIDATAFDGVRVVPLEQLGAAVDDLLTER